MGKEVENEKNVRQQDNVVEKSQAVDAFRDEFRETPLALGGAARAGVAAMAQGALEAGKAANSGLNEASQMMKLPCFELDRNDRIDNLFKSEGKGEKNGLNKTENKLENKAENKIEKMIAEKGEMSFVKDLDKWLLPNHRVDGVQSLSTGDHIVREDGKETLFTPNGDRVTVNPDGTHSIKGEVSKVSSDRDGTVNVQFADGGKVSLDRKGILSVERDGQAIHFGRFIDIPRPLCVNPPGTGPRPRGLEFDPSTILNKPVQSSNPSFEWNGKR